MACNAVGNLSYGTRAENVADMIRDGVMSRGSGHYNAKLTEIKVQEILQKAFTGTAPAFLAKEYDISRAVIHKIIQGKKWKHVPRPSRGESG
jgi:hypothetical protein